jgi:hypothetical protein
MKDILDFFLIAKFQGLKLLIYWTILILSFLLFQHPDLYHTATSSYAFLEGHFIDFYDYNKSVMEFTHYLPIIYLLYAIWNLPIYLLDFTTSPEKVNFSWVPLNLPSAPIEIIWWKILLIFLFFSSVHILGKISEFIEGDKNTSKFLAKTLFATSPIAIFSIFIFGGYDIFSVFFTLIGFYYYLKRNIHLFIFFFSIAISFKFFAAIIFLPLLLLIEKNPLNIFKYCFFVSLFVLLQCLIYWHSSIFRDEIFFQLLSKTQGDHSLIKSFLKFSMFLIYLTMCFNFFRSNSKNERDFQCKAVFACICSYALLFLAVVWSPQYILIITPFVALSYFFIKNKKLLAYVDILGMFLFVWCIVNRWANNVDVSMINFSPFHHLLPQPLHLNSDFMYGNKSLARFLFNFYLFFPFMLFLLETKFQFKNHFGELSDGLIFNRFLIGLSFFLIPSLLCFTTV